MAIFHSSIWLAADQTRPDQTRPDQTREIMLCLGRVERIIPAYTGRARNNVNYNPPPKILKLGPIWLILYSFDK
jgi:hypothetical protein